MPPRDTQDYEQRRQQIIDGALKTFARKGFEKATNKDIAEAAGIGSPGLIYHYFKDKADLFQQVVKQRVPVLRLLMHPEPLMDLPPREGLLIIGRGYLQALAQPSNVALFRLLIGEAMRKPHIADMINQIIPGRAFAALSAYLARQMDAGRLRRIDPGIATRSFLGPLMLYILSREIFPQPDRDTLDPETMVAAAIDIFLNGMEIDASAS